MLAEMLQRGLFGFPFELLPLTGGVVIVTAQQPSHREVLRLIEGHRHLVIISVVHLGAGFLGSPPQRAERRQLIARFHQGFDADIENSGDDVLTLGGLEQGGDEDPPPAIAEGGNTTVGTDLRDVPLAEAPLLIVLEGLVGNNTPSTVAT